MNDPVCDRCHRDDGTVELHDFCLICGPTPWCSECARTHLDEVRAGVDW